MNILILISGDETSNAMLVKEREDKELERCATFVVRSFSRVNDVRKKIEQHTVAIDQFSKLKMKDGAVPKGYKLVNGTCVFDREFLMSGGSCFANDKICRQDKARCLVK